VKAPPKNKILRKLAPGTIAIVCRSTLAAPIDAQEERFNRIVKVKEVMAP